VPVHVPGGRTAVAGLIVHLLKRHAGLPAGTTLAVAIAGLRLDLKVPRRQQPLVGMPLKVTPRLSRQRFVFPVVGHVDYGDSYGGYRGDVPGNWHHGDDLFAALGTPVVAVASGTINRVGWETLGGWRLWVRDRAGDQFYYAHLSGYALPRLGKQRVHVGQVLGFVGNTGDAITTPPHLHFEVHPKPLRHLGYDGAVDPTTYLDAWAHVGHVQAPRPVHPALPLEPAIRREARSVFHELLAARGLLPDPSRPAEQQRIVLHPAAAAPRAQDAAPRAAAAIRRASDGGELGFALLAGLACLGACGAAMVVPPVRRRALEILRER
jgi:hypothetical protein